MNVDEGDEHEWIGGERGLLGRLIERRVPLIGLCLGGQMVAAAAGAVPRRAPRPEIGWHPVELTDDGPRRPAARPARPRLRGLPVAQLRVPAAARRGGARPQRRLPAGRPGSASSPGRSSSTPRSAPPTPCDWIDDYETDADAVRIGVDPTALALETEAKIGAFNELGRDLCGRWLDVAAARS